MGAIVRGWSQMLGYHGQKEHGHQQYYIHILGYTKHQQSPPETSYMNGMAVIWPYEIPNFW